MGRGPLFLEKEECIPLLGVVCLHNQGTAQLSPPKLLSTNPLLTVCPSLNGFQEFPVVKVFTVLLKLLKSRALDASFLLLYSKSPAYLVVPGDQQRVSVCSRTSGLCS